MSNKERELQMSVCLFKGAVTVVLPSCSLNVTLTSARRCTTDRLRSPPADREREPWWKATLRVSTLRVSTRRVLCPVWTRPFPTVARSRIARAAANKRQPPRAAAAQCPQSIYPRALDTRARQETSPRNYSRPLTPNSVAESHKKIFCPSQNLPSRPPTIPLSLTGNDCRV